MSIENETNVKLKKFTFDYVDITGANRQYVQESKENGLRSVNLPFNFNKLKAGDVTFILEREQGTTEEYDDIEFLKYLVDKDLVTNEDAEKYEVNCRQSLTIKDLTDEYFKQVSNDQQDFPKMTYFDVTEKDMFGYEALTATDLLSNGGNGGIWGMHGLRKLEIIVEGMDIEDAADFTERANLYWYQRDGEEIPRIFETDIRWRKDYADGRKYIAYINTNRLGESAAEAESNYPEFNGRFELHHEYIDEVITYTFPIKICVHDTTIDNKGKNHLLETNIVSIDFGTSSTCAAIRGTGRPRLFTLSGKEKRMEDGDNAYENPTNLMIYKWDEVYNQWQMDNENCPFVLTRSQEHDESEAGYDSGYTVADEYKEVGEEDGRRKMSAILTQLKLIPYLRSYGKEIKLTPYHGKNRSVIRITDSLERSENTDQKFNPIAFYGYLLSRAINNPKENRFYRNYRITYPVKFDKEVRETIRASLEYGIMRALPKPLRMATNKKGDPLVTVKMEYAEPVACVGAIVGSQLQISHDSPEAKLFAIYDLGGGTLDFAFGMFRPSRTEDELEMSDFVIEILGIGGDDKVGGEKLIHKLAYKIYKDSREEVEEKGIKFVLPIGELPPDGFEDILRKDGDDISDTNVNLLKEKLARPLFKYTDDIGSLTDENLKLELLKSELGQNNGSENKVVDATHYSMLMRDQSGDDVQVTLKVENVSDFLSEEIKSTINSFKKEMEQTFTGNLDRLREAGLQNFNVDDVYIFLGGNASKQYHVEEDMNEKFPKNKEQNHIQRIGDGQNKEDLNKQFTVNEKTAVAFGQLNLGQYVVNQEAISKEADMPPFLFNVGYKDSGTGVYVPVLQKNDNTRTWKKANRIDNESYTTNLLYTTNPQCNPDTMETLEEDVSDAVEGTGLTLYIRIYEEDSIEYRVGKTNDILDDEEEPDEDKVLKLVVVK